MPAGGLTSILPPLNPIKALAGGKGGPGGGGPPQMPLRQVGQAETPSFAGAGSAAGGANTLTPEQRMQLAMILRQG